MRMGCELMKNNIYLFIFLLIGTIVCLCNLRMQMNKYSRYKAYVST